MGFLFTTAYVGRSLGFAQAWTLIFIAGASTTGVYLLLTPIALAEKLRTTILFSRMTKRAIILVLAYAPIIAGLTYWIRNAGSVEALPIFPAFIIIFYTWILLQAYFIAAPVSQLLVKVEKGLSGEGHAKKIMRTLGISTLFLPIAPLTYAVWAISNWLNSTYQNVPGATGKIIIWTIIVTVLLLASYFFTALWGWRVIVQKRPEAAIFGGGTFLVLWGYLLYRATMIAIGYITQNLPTNPLVDSSLMVVSVIGAMQTFSRRTLSRADRRWSQALPFLVFAFGSVYAVAQFYFILQVPITRIDLSIITNATIFAAGIFTMMFLIRRHLATVELSAFKAQMNAPTPSPSESPTISPQPRQPLFHWLRKKPRKAPESQPEEEDGEAVVQGQVVDSSEQTREADETAPDIAASGMEHPEENPDSNDQDY